MIKVRATQLGFYGASRKRPGDVFVINGKQELGKWMEVVEEVSDEPKRAKGGKSREPAVSAPEQKPPASTGDQDVI